jgi:hypothetical protein
MPLATPRPTCVHYWHQILGILACMSTTTPIELPAMMLQTLQKRNKSSQNLIRIWAVKQESAPHRKLVEKTQVGWRSTGGLVDINDYLLSLQSSVVKSHKNGPLFH